jgi:hypothetical protein
LSDPQFAVFLERLYALSLPAYTLSVQYAQPELLDGTLRLGFAAGALWGRAACAYAQSEELLAACAAAAESSYDTNKVCIGIAGEEAGWKCSGSPFEIGSPAGRPAPISGNYGSSATSSTHKEAAPPADAAHELFARKASRPAAPDQATDNFRDEAEVTAEHVLGEHQRTDPQPRELEGGVEQLGSQIDKVAKPIMINTPATVEDVLELFGATMLPDDEQ